MPSRYVQSDMACDWPSEWELETKKDMSGSLKFHWAPVSRQLDSVLQFGGTCKFCDTEPRQSVGESLTGAGLRVSTIIRPVVYSSIF